MRRTSIGVDTSNHAQIARIVRYLVARRPPRTDSTSSSEPPRTTPPATTGRRAGFATWNWPTNARRTRSAASGPRTRPTSGTPRFGEQPDERCEVRVERLSGDERAPVHRTCGQRRHREVASVIGDRPTAPTDSAHVDVPDVTICLGRQLMYRVVVSTSPAPLAAAVGDLDAETACDPPAARNCL